MEILKLLVPADTAYILDQIISSYRKDGRILRHFKEIGLTPQKDKQQIFSSYAIHFNKLEDVFAFGLDSGKCMLAAEMMDDPENKKGG